VIEMVMLSIFR